MVEWSEVGLRVRRLGACSRARCTTRQPRNKIVLLSTTVRIQQIEIPNEVNHSMTIDAPAIPIADSDSYHDTADRTSPQPARAGASTCPCFMPFLPFFTDNRKTPAPLEAHPRPSSTPNPACPQEIPFQPIPHEPIPARQPAGPISDAFTVRSLRFVRLQLPLVCLRAFRGGVFIREAGPP